MFEVKKGMTRIALLCGPIVLKFPHLTYGFRSFLTGIIANISEFAIWWCVKEKATFLAPTLFTLGIVNIQLRERGEMVIGRDLAQRYRLLDIEARNLIPRLGGHALHPANWVKNKNGYRLVDYGDMFISEYIQLSGFIWMFHEQLSGVLSAGPDVTRLDDHARNELAWQRLMDDSEWCRANDGKYVAFSGGVLIAMADTRRDLIAQLETMEHTKIVRAGQIGEDEEQVVEISTPFFD